MAFVFTVREPDAFAVSVEIVNLSCFRQPFAVLIHGAHGQKDMGVRIAVSFVVDRKSRDHTVGNKLFPAVIADKGFIFIFRDFIRQRHDDSAGKLGVPLPLGLLHGIPEDLPIDVFRRGVRREKDPFCQDLSRLVLIILRFTVVFRKELFAALIGGSGDNGLPFAPLSDRNGKMRTGYFSSPSFMWVAGTAQGRAL